ncbi:metallophosphoesterase family protein [Coralliovum pocilloporae]|uniref:metallophosphoesterase family protein n=1 Tax=Coralliovum pocilloporae TaxID=3066369 RepID=UPI003306A14A
MFRLAHISDPHLGPLPDPSGIELASKRVLGYINWRKNRARTLTNTFLDGLLDDMRQHSPNHIAVTGDLVNLALKAEFKPARQWLTTLGKPADVSVVPGNHDAYVPGALAEAERCWHDYMCGDGHPNGLRPTYPYVRIRGNVALIGVSSARATGPFMATGYIDSIQARHLTELLAHLKDERLFRVVMIHHPPIRGATHWHKRLIAASRFRTAIKKSGAELVLHGHTHLATRMSLPGPEMDVPVICVPSASASPGGRRPAARYNLFEIDGDAGNWSCTMIERGFSQENRTEVQELGHHILL